LGALVEDFFGMVLGRLAIDKGSKRIPTKDGQMTSIVLGFTSQERQDTKGLHSLGPEILWLRVRLSGGFAVDSYQNFDSWQFRGFLAFIKIGFSSM
jgi:hypothetical protein